MVASTRSEPARPFDPPAIWRCACGAEAVRTVSVPLADNTYLVSWGLCPAHLTDDPDTIRMMLQTVAARLLIDLGGGR